MNNYVIKVNRAKCCHCGWVIESQSCFHLNICGCGKLGVDGGLDALRRYGTDYDELSEFFNEIGLSDDLS